MMENNLISDEERRKEKEKMNRFINLKILTKNYSRIKMDITISPEEDNIWLSKNQIAELFDRDRSVISKHIKKIFDDYECDEKSNVQKMHIPNSDKLVEFDSLDIIIAVGFKTNSKRAIIFRRWANKVLKEYLLQGYVINEKKSLVTNENYVRLINKVESLDERVSNIENNYKPLEFKASQLFFDGQLYDAYTLIQSLFESANNEIIIIDNYVDRTILDRLVVKNRNVQVIIYTSINTRLLGRDINTFNSQYGGLDVRYTTNVHDRYIIIDQNKIYHLGHSIKDLGKKIFSISESDSNLISKLLSNI